MNTTEATWKAAKNADPALAALHMALSDLAYEHKTALGKNKELSGLLIILQRKVSNRIYKKIQPHDIAFKSVVTG